MPVNQALRLTHAYAERDAGFKNAVQRTAAAIGYDLTHLQRKVCNEACKRLIESLDPQRLDVLEISAGETWRRLPFRSYRTLDYPAHDICDPAVAPELDGSFDLIIADQVFEHLLRPYRAGRNVLRLLRPGGHFLVMTPFMIRIHDVPVDCTRWTETGLRHFLIECGFDPDGLHAGSWGNLDAVKANFVVWGRVGWRRKLPNDPRYPVAVWALARKPPAAP